MPYFTLNFFQFVLALQIRVKSYLNPAKFKLTLIKQSKNECKNAKFQVSHTPFVVQDSPRK